MSLVSRPTDAKYAQRLFQHEFGKFTTNREILVHEIIRQCPGHYLQKLASKALTDGSVDPVAGWDKPPSAAPRSFSAPFDPSLQDTNSGIAVNKRVPYYEMGRPATQARALDSRSSAPAASGSTHPEGGYQQIANVATHNQEETDPFANHKVNFSRINKRIEAAVEAEDYSNRTMADGVDENGESGGNNLSSPHVVPVHDVPMDDLPVDDLSPNDPPPENPTQNETDPQEKPADTTHSRP